MAEAAQAPSSAIERRPPTVGDCQRCPDGRLRLKRVDRFVARYAGREHRENVVSAHHGYAECLECGEHHESIRPEEEPWGARFPDETALTSRRWHPA